MRGVIVGLVVLASFGARAQPAPPTGPPGTVAQVSAPPASQPVLALTPEEQRLLARGPISDGRIMLGTLFALSWGFGLGQAIEGRWHETGWIFTLADAVGAAILMGSMADCVSRGEGFSGPPCNDALDTTLDITGAAVLLVSRVAGVHDAVAGADDDNARLGELRARLAKPVSQLAPYVAPVRGPRTSGGAIVGLTLRF